eukprot:53184_1
MAKVLNLPSNLTGGNPEQWHDEELCAKINGLFCSESECTTFDDFFPEKGDDFEFIEEGHPTYDKDNYESIVNNMKDAIDSAPGGINVSCAFQSIDETSSGVYELVSHQSVSVFLNSPSSFWPIEFTVSEHIVTYKFTKDELISITMQNNDHSDSTVSNIIYNLRRILEDSKDEDGALFIPIAVIVICAMAGVTSVIAIVLCICVSSKNKTLSESVEEEQKNAAADAPVNTSVQ